MRAHYDITIACCEMIMWVCLVLLYDFFYEINIIIFIYAMLYVTTKAKRHHPCSILRIKTLLMFKFSFVFPLIMCCFIYLFPSLFFFGFFHQFYIWLIFFFIYHLIVNFVVQFKQLKVIGSAATIKAMCFFPLIYLLLF